jgi:hypothetical protein
VFYQRGYHAALMHRWSCDNVLVESDFIFLLVIVNISTLNLLDINSEFCTITIFIIADS